MARQSKKSKNNDEVVVNTLDQTDEMINTFDDIDLESNMDMDVLNELFGNDNMESDDIKEDTSMDLEIDAELEKDLAKELANVTGSVLGSSRPAAQVRKYVPLRQYIGVSGRKFAGELYIGIGISGASQHLRGLEDAKKVVVINNDESAPFFKRCDYGIVGDFHEVVPALIEEIKNL